MRPDRPSWTARAVAISRALASGSRGSQQSGSQQSGSQRGSAGSIVDPGDSIVRELLPTSSKLALHLLESSGLAGLSARASLGFVDHIALRAAIIDREIERAVQLGSRQEPGSHQDAGLRQLVILGAGLDTRAHRLSALSEVEVYELDFPSTQREKQASANSLQRVCKTLRYVPIDFERDDIGARLSASGHDAQRATLWILEGVVPYLTQAAIERLLDQVSRASAPGSLLVLSYVPDDSLWMKLTKPALHVVLTVAGEPMRTPLSAAALGSLLSARGLQVLRDSDPEQWARELHAQPKRRLVQYERLAVARKAP